MWPLNLSARELLKPPGTTWITWATFDADWYRAAYANATGHLADASADAVLRFYLDAGQALGHSPNLLFDEAWHRRTYPEIAALVQAGQFASAFDAYCRGGCVERSPHWLFDERQYRRRYPDLTNKVLADRGLVNGYDHYLWRGAAEGRMGHPLFDPAFYRAQLDPAEAAAVAAEGPFRHCLQRFDRREPEVRTSLYFDPAWYLTLYPTVREAIGQGTWRWALEHYLNNDTPTKFDPNAAFSDTYYLARDPDQGAMVKRREVRNGYEHFLLYGVHEARSPSEPIDLAWYAAQDVVRRDLEQGLAPDAFAHWLKIGQARGLLTAPAVEQPITEIQAKTLFRDRARTLAALFGRTQLDFKTAGAPVLSVIIVLHNQFALTMLALGSLRANYPGDIELILVDSGSTDQTRSIERYVLGVKYLRFDTNIGYLLGCNAALPFATADAVLYLNNYIELAPGAIANALRRLESDPRIGVVGCMVIRTHGLVQEAGNIIWRDGTTQGYMRDASPLAPEVNFVRDVDFCSGVFLMTRRTLLHELEGFDEAFAPAYYEDTDLCIRIAAAGYRIVYDPSVVLHHLEYGSATSSRASEAEIGHSRQVFVRKHADYLGYRHDRDDQTHVFARLADTLQKRVLFVEDMVPLRTIGSGFVRSNDLVKVMASMGYGVTVYPLNGNGFDLAHIHADMPDTVEVMHDHSMARLREFLSSRLGYYDAVWVARTHNLDGLRDALDQTQGRSSQKPLIVLDTEAIASLREAEQAMVEGRPFDFDAAVAHELRNVASCDRIVAVTELEAATLHGLGISNVTVIGHMRALRPTPRSFARRAGMLFVGAIHRMDSPNYDSLCWFVDEILPLIERELGWQTRLTVAGYTSPGVTLERLQSHPRVIWHGEVANLEPLYDSHRVFVAPTRIAAGVPYKVHESASFGLPVVATELLRRQLGWNAGQDILTARADDPSAFARQVLMLLQDEELWQRLRDSSLERLRQECNQEHYTTMIAGVLGSPRIVNRPDA